MTHSDRTGSRTEHSSTAIRRPAAASLLLAFALMAGACGGATQEASDATTGNDGSTTPAVTPTAPSSAGDFSSHGLYAVDIDTGEPTLFLESEEVSFKNVTIAPDGDRVAFAAEDGDGRSQIFVINADGTDRRQLTHGSPGAAAPAWSPDGGEIAFRGMDQDGTSDVYVAAAGSGDTLQLTYESRDVDYALSWSPDGETIFYQITHPSVIRRVDIKTGTTTTILEDAALPDVSPDGSRIAFNTWSFGKVTLANIDGSDRMLIESGFDTNSPKWSPNGERIALRDLDDQTYVYEVSTGKMRLVTPGSIVDWLDGQTLLVSVI